MTISIRQYRSQDLGQVVKLWGEANHPLSAVGLSVDEVADLVTSGAAVTQVAEVDGEVKAVALGSASGPMGWIYRISVSPDGFAHDEVVDQLLDRLESCLAEQGARKIMSLLSERDQIQERLEARGYQLARSAVCLERPLPVTTSASEALAQVGGVMADRGLWEQLRGMHEAKEIIERRVILPLSNPNLASRHAVSPPSGIVLFGPPGTGKTTFGKALAGRLDWAFVEIQPREFVGEAAERQGKLLAQTFDDVFELGSAVVFVDEVEDLASMRDSDRKLSAQLTNEFLKQIPRFRDASHHLLVCATNMVGRLDPAFLRPGRFDCVVPVGPPDEEARTAIWTRYVEEITDEPIDMRALVEASELFTPADIEFAARKAAQKAFEREHFEEQGRRAATADFLEAIRETTPTLTEEMVQDFREDARRFTRY